MLLRRYGVVFRDLLARETNLPRWRELQIGYPPPRRSRRSARRTLRRWLSGRAVRAPVAVESLRANRKLPQCSGERIVIAAADPLNLVGIVVPGERIPAISGRSVTFRDGVWDSGGCAAICWLLAFAIRCSLFAVSALRSSLTADSA